MTPLTVRNHSNLSREAVVQLAERYRESIRESTYQLVITRPREVVIIRPRGEDILVIALGK